eukprot:Colp12_sorted_trinity150504_noHs@9693
MAKLFALLVLTGCTLAVLAKPLQSDFQNLTSAAARCSGDRCGASGGGCSCGGAESCCSQYDYCGATAAHCGSGCQAAYSASGSCKSGPGPAPPPSGVIAGYWWWTWSGSQRAPAGTTLSIAFSGEKDPSKAVSESAGIKGKLPGLKFLDIGGGDASGRWSASQLNSVISATNSGKFAGYNGIAYDIEEGDSGLAGLFKQAFAAAKAHGLQVLVTISHSQPYGIPDAQSLMTSILADPNVDYISPQLYSSGNESQNEYDAEGTQWTAYRNTRAAIIPSIVSANMYESARQYFAGKGVTLRGYIQWKQA